MLREKLDTATTVHSIGYRARQRGTSLRIENEIRAIDELPEIPKAKSAKFGAGGINF
jgi:hypothetical protein